MMVSSRADPARQVNTPIRGAADGHEIIVLVLSIAVMMIGSAAAQAQQDPTRVRREAALWLELNQNADGSWGVGDERALVTAEALEALSAVGLETRPAARRAIEWLAGSQFLNVDYRSRSLRALSKAGVLLESSALELDSTATTGSGLGLLNERNPNSVDSAIAYSAIASVLSPVQATSASVLEAAIFAGQRSDGGWAGAGIPVDPDTPSSRVLTAEIIRALADAGLGGVPFEGTNFISSTETALPDSGLAPSASMTTLEIASRMIAIQKFLGGAIDTPLRTELLNSARFTGEVWGGDALVNARGLLALAASVDASISECVGDIDCDLTLDADDAAPLDAASVLDSDGDGIADLRDSDRDGDGIANGVDLFPDDGTEWLDSDADGIGDFSDPDDDNDSQTDFAELDAGTSTYVNDSDGDGVPDGSDPCPLIKFVLGGGPGGTHLGVDGDLDSICTPTDQCDDYSDPRDFRDLDGDGTCDGVDNDDDGDGSLDRHELAWGTDSRDPSSNLDALLADNPDLDGDGLLNTEETTLELDPFLADSDSDGFTDMTELHVLGGGVSAAAALNGSIQPNSHWYGFPASSAAQGVATGTPTTAEMLPWLADAGPTLELASTGGQSTPPGLLGDPRASLRPGIQLVSGLDAALFRIVDQDGDGLLGEEELSLGTHVWSPDSDADGFTDGAGVLAIASMPTGMTFVDLNGDGIVDGEADFATSPTDRESRPGAWGDTAPLGGPDGSVNVADQLILARYIRDPIALLATLSATQSAILDNAADVSGSDGVDVADLLMLIRYIDDPLGPIMPPSAPPDSDFDGVADDLDLCPDSLSFQTDWDFDGVGDGCDSCPVVPNSLQQDLDGDGLGDVCDDDRDGDYWTNAADNCPNDSNPDQGDADLDGIGDVCDV